MPRISPSDEFTKTPATLSSRSSALMRACSAMRSALTKVIAVVAFFASVALKTPVTTKSSSLTASDLADVGASDEVAGATCAKEVRAAKKPPENSRRCMGCLGWRALSATRLGYVVNLKRGWGQRAPLRASRQRLEPDFLELNRHRLAPM